MVEPQHEYLPNCPPARPPPSRAPFSPQSLLDGGSLTVFSAQGWCRIGGLFATALASAACMPTIVERSKKAVRDKFWDMKHPKQIYPVAWLVERFKPVKGW
jgi:hypothetical protein